MKISNELRKILDTAREENASDIHVIAGMPPAFRISGEIIIADIAPLSGEDTARLVAEMLNDEQKAAFQRDWQLSCSVFDQELGRFRVSVYYRNANPEMAIRPINLRIQSREELRLPEAAEKLTRHSSGLILITGPTGSGKTTTLNYMIDLINSERRCKIITVEDPIEYVHPHKKAIVIQQELFTDVKSFSSALIHVLRQNPDVICIGEMRDYETTSTALMAAETGHLVIATCHTPNAYQTVERIVAVFPPHQQSQIVVQLANSLLGIIAHRLVPRIDKLSRLLASEVLIVNPAARHVIRESTFHQLINVIQTNAQEGMYSMDDCLLRMYHAGEISYDTAMATAYDQQYLRGRIHPGA
jgi:twitching motility protein PilT